MRTALGLLLVLRLACIVLPSPSQDFIFISYRKQYASGPLKAQKPPHFDLIVWAVGISDRHAASTAEVVADWLEQVKHHPMRKKVVGNEQKILR